MTCDAVGCMGRGEGTDRVIRSSEHRVIGTKSFTAKDAQPPQQAKTGLAGGPGHAKESTAYH
jgi:hypothetical protein